MSFRSPVWCFSCSSIPQIMVGKSSLLEVYTSTVPSEISPSLDSIVFKRRCSNTVVGAGFGAGHLLLTLVLNCMAVIRTV